MENDQPVQSAILSQRAAPILIGLAVTAVLFALYRPFPIGVAQDDGLYMILAKAISTGQGYRFINLPGAPAGVHYPPGYPLLLAGLSWLSGGIPGNPFVFAAANMVLLGIAAAFAYVLARYLGMGRALAAACVAAGFLMPPAVWMITALFSEPMWLALALPWLVWATGKERRDEIDAPSAVALGLSAGLITLVRTQAATLVLALVFVLAIRRQWRVASIVLLSAAAVMVPWQLWVGHHAAEIPAAVSAKYGPYFSWFVEGLRSEGPRLVTATIARNFVASIAIVRALLAPVGPLWLATIIIAAPTIAGAWRLARRSPIVLFAIAGHFAIIIAWPFEPRRFIWSSWPLMMLWLVAGALELWEQAQRVRSLPAPDFKPWRVARPLVLVDLGILALSAAGTSAVMLRSGAHRGIAMGQARRIGPTVEWVGQHTPPGTLVASDDETAVFLYTGRPAVPVASFGAAEYGRGEGSSRDVFDGIVGAYHPAVAIVSWERSVQAVARMTQGSRPLYRPLGRTQVGVVFAVNP
ncbi:MAG TPA: hypothetical protein VNS10_06845 [Gemmatimonadaceae bacterium]|jgi:hypothetical protein|nr:hypothetical protein [Gemmatimonadaceae bacterium]